MDDPQFVVEIAQQGSISKAACRMNMTQPALSYRLKQLELHLGTNLFDRKSAPLSPTLAGKRYLKWAKHAIVAKNRMERDIEAISQKTQRNLTIGVSLPRCDKLLPKIIRQFNDQERNCTLSFTGLGKSKTLSDALGNGEIDFAVLTPSPADATLFESEELVDERLLLMTPRTWTLECTGSDGGIPTIQAETLSSLPFIMPPASYHLNWIVRTMATVEGIELDIALNSCSNDLTIKLIEQGLGASILPSTLCQHNDSIAPYAIEGYSRTHHLYLSHRKDWHPNSDAQLFIALLRNHFACEGKQEAAS